MILVLFYISKWPLKQTYRRIGSSNWILFLALWLDYFSPLFHAVNPTAGEDRSLQCDLRGSVFFFSWYPIISGAELFARHTGDDADQLWLNLWRSFQATDLLNYQSFLVQVAHKWTLLGMPLIKIDRDLDLSFVLVLLKITLFFSSSRAQSTNDSYKERGDKDAHTNTHSICKTRVPGRLKSV